MFRTERGDEHQSLQWVIVCVDAVEIVDDEILVSGRCEPFRDPEEPGTVLNPEATEADDGEGEERVTGSDA